jgi:hypothetical protein
MHSGFIYQLFISIVKDKQQQRKEQTKSSYINTQKTKAALKRREHDKKKRIYFLVFVNKNPTNSPIVAATTAIVTYIVLPLSSKINKYSISILFFSYF